MRTTRIIIADKCKRGESHGSLLFSPNIGRGQLIMIPFNFITSKEDAEIIVTNSHKEKATALTIHTWYFKKIETELRTMGSSNVTLPQE